jgi:outer membrane protein assembly factor BamB
MVTGNVDSYGSILAFYIDPVNHWMLKWNSTKLLTSVTGDLYIPPIGRSIDWSAGIEWNVTTPDRGKLGFYMGAGFSNGDVILASNADILDEVQNITVAAYSTKDGHELWHSDFAGIFVPGSTLYEFIGTFNDGILTIYDKNTLQWWGFDIYTGAKLWGPTTPYTNGWDTFIVRGAGYGKLYVGTYGGNIYCHDLKTGKLLWNYTLPPSGYDTPYGTYPITSNAIYPAITVADGKVYVITGEHTPNSPYWLGGALYVVNATTGDLVYKMPGWWSNNPAIADGYALNHNCYDGQIYCFGKGRTAVTVSAPDTAITQGQSVIIKGTVMDKSPGTMNYAGNQLSEGSPAIADAYMTQWMEYLYQQKPMPTNATGVPVSIDVIDANGNLRNIGTTTSDATGKFSYVWQPDISGKYTVIASFAGSESYYRSSDETAFVVTDAPTPVPTQQVQTGLATTSDILMYMAATAIAIIVAIAIATVLLLRKRP